MSETIRTDEVLVNDLPNTKKPTEMSKTSKTIEVAVISSLIAALIVGIIAYVINVKVNEFKIGEINKNIDKIQSSLANIEKTQIQNTGGLGGFKRENNEIKESLKETRKSLNKLILALVSNDKLGIDYKQFTSLKTIEDLHFNVLVKLANEIKKTRKIINKKKYSSDEKFAIIEKFFDDISDVYWIKKSDQIVVANDIFNFKFATGGSSD